jgi:hypothetical protein
MLVIGLDTKGTGQETECQDLERGMESIKQSRRKGEGENLVGQEGVGRSGL